MKKQKKKKMSLKKRLAVALACFIFICAGILGGLQLGVVYADKTWVHWRPDYEQADISGILDKQTLSEEDYDALYAQTGLTKLGVDGLLESNDKSRILSIQNFYFSDWSVTCTKINPFTYIETMKRHAPFAKLENGDIIVSATTHVSGWRLGHACLVVDGTRGLIAEALGPGENSRIASADAFSNLAGFLVLRPKLPQELKDEVAEYAKENLIGVPYYFTVGIFSKKNAKNFTQTQCAHLVWYAYKQFGIDLDSNGGLVVTPPEIAHSPYVEAVQVFGFDPEILWP